MPASKGNDPGGGKDLLVDKPVELVPPDGGWGWVVVFAFALSNVICVPIIQSFGLLFRDRFDQLDMSGTDLSVIINVNSSFGMILGLFNGYLLKGYGYRKIAILGTAIHSTGVILTSYADSFVFFLITYGLITSMGFNLLSSAFNLALNSYFREKRGKAVGFAATAMGLGPVLMPLLISVLLRQYGTTGTAFLLGGLSLHSLVAALLLHPVKWHMIPKKISLEELEEANEEEDTVEDTEKHKCLHGATRRQRTITASSSIDHDIDVQSIYGFDTPLTDRKTPARRRSSISFKRSTSHVDDKQKPSDGSWWASAASVNTVNLGSSMKIFDEKPYQPLREVNEHRKGVRSTTDNEEDGKTAVTLSVPAVNGIRAKNRDAHEKGNDDTKEEEEEDESKLTFWQRLGRGIVASFDLTLLKDPVYVNLMLGMSIAVCAEFNFSLLTPFILKDRGFDTERTAIIMSVIAGLDIVFRFIVPFFSDHYKISARNMYTFALVLLVSSRTALIFSETFNAVMTVAVALGVAKGVRTVYMTIVIPNYVPIDRLAAASGIQMVTNGILLLSFGPIMGVIRDISGSYNWCIAFINMLTIVTITMWTAGFILSWLRNRTTTDSKS